MSEAALAQAQGDIDRAVEEGVQALQRAEEDAQPGFQTMRDQIDSAERMTSSFVIVLNSSHCEKNFCRGFDPSLKYRKYPV